MTNDDVLIELQNMVDVEERVQWYYDKRAGLFLVFTELWEKDKQKCEMFIDDFLNYFSGHAAKFRKQIKNGIAGILRARLQDRLKDHGEFELKVNDKQKMLPTQPNLVEVLSKSKHIFLCYDEFSGREYYEIYGGRKLPWENDVRDGWIEITYLIEHKDKATNCVRYYDVHSPYQMASLKRYLNIFFPDEVSWRALPDAIIDAAMHNRVNVQQDYYRYGLPEWDGKDHYDYFCKYCGVKNEKWGRIVGKRLILSIMARCFDPGFDYRGAAVLVGPENSGKSRLCKLLAFHPQFYTYMFLDDRIQGYEIARMMKGMAVTELMEGGNLKHMNNDRMKVLTTATFDINRPLYAQSVQHNARPGILIFTVNPGGFLPTQDDNTRYMVIECDAEKIDIDGLAAELPQILAQGLYDWQHGETPRLTAEEELLQQKMVRPHEMKNDLLIPIVELVRMNKAELLNGGIKVETIVNGLTTNADGSEKFEKDYWISKKSKFQIEQSVRAVLKKLQCKSCVDREGNGTRRSWKYQGKDNFDNVLNEIEND